MKNKSTLKQEAAQAAISYVKPGILLGVGTGSTVNYFIDALAKAKIQIHGAISSSKSSTECLKSYNIRVLQATDKIDLYIDGADEIDSKGYMIKGGGGALTGEKILASQADRFICIADEAKQVNILGKFALPIEIIPIANSYITNRFLQMKASAKLRINSNGYPFVTDNGQHILDVTGLNITNPLELETEINQWPGVLTVGLFARQRAHLYLLATQQGLQTLKF